MTEKAGNCMWLRSQHEIHRVLSPTPGVLPSSADRDYPAFCSSAPFITRDLEAPRTCRYSDTHARATLPVIVIHSSLPRVISITRTLLSPRVKRGRADKRQAREANHAEITLGQFGNGHEFPLKAVFGCFAAFHESLSNHRPRRVSQCFLLAAQASIGNRRTYDRYLQLDVQHERLCEECVCRFAEAQFWSPCRVRPSSRCL